MAQEAGAQRFPEEARGPGAALCSEHALARDWLCRGGRRPACARCLTCPGGCREHRLRPLAEEAADRRNKIVDQCEKLQLQRATIAKFVGEVLPKKKQHVVAVANSAREVLIQRLNLVKSVCESEEQRLLEAVHAEEERAQQNLSTQHVHWNDSLRKLDSLHSFLVAMITAPDDCTLLEVQSVCTRRRAFSAVVPRLWNAFPREVRLALTLYSFRRQDVIGNIVPTEEVLRALLLFVGDFQGISAHFFLQAEEEIYERAEEAEGILKPQDSEKLNFNSRCVQSPLLNQLWASAVLCVASDEVLMDEKTISPLLVLSEDRKTLTFSPGKTRANLDGPERFDHWPNGLAEESFCAGVHAWKVSVAKSCAYKVGVAYPSVQRKGSGPQARLGCNLSSWVFSRYDKEFQFSHNHHHQAVHLLKCPLEIGVLVDLDAGQLLFYDPESCTILYTHHETFTGPVYPALAVADQSISLVSCD